MSKIYFEAIMEDMRFRAMHIAWASSGKVDGVPGDFNAVYHVWKNIIKYIGNSVKQVNSRKGMLLDVTVEAIYGPRRGLRGRVSPPYAEDVEIRTRIYISDIGNAKIMAT